MENLVKQRLGLIIILATILVMGLTSFLLVRDQQAKSLENIRANGEALTRLLSNIPFEQLAPENRQGGILQLLKLYLRESELAYVAIVNTDGQLVNRISKPGISLPEINQQSKTLLWLDERELHIKEMKVDVIEYHAPLLKAGELAGYVRTGYIKNSLSSFLQQSYLMAQVSLPIFILMLFFYYLLQKEMKPLQMANKKICDLISEQHLNMTIETNGDLKHFINNFNHFMALAKKQASDMESLRLEAQTSSQLLSYQKHRVESALQTLPDAIIIFDDAGNTTFANSKIESVIGFSASEIQGKQAHEWCDDTEVRVLLSQYHSNISPLHRTETIKYVPKKYPEKTVLVSVYPLFSPKDSSIVYGTLVSFRDVSEQVMANQARDEFIAHVSHELKSPLNVVGMHAELLLEEDVDKNEQISSANIIIDEVERLGKLINDLLKITSFESGNITLDRQRIKLHDFLSDVFNAATRSAIEKEITTNLEIARSITSITIDKELLRIALNNILSNAIKYNNVGGTISMLVDEYDDTLQIQVVDDGIGMSEHDREHVFDKFYRSEDEDARKRPGHGLGMALTKEIVQLLGGQISIESIINKGTTFTITLMKTSTFLKEVI